MLPLPSNLVISSSIMTKFGVATGSENYFSKITEKFYRNYVTVDL